VSTENDNDFGANAGPQRRLMHMKLYNKIADRFHGDIKVAQGVPYSIAALEDLLAVGSSDGSVRIFDHNEREIKTLVDKQVKSQAVTSLDIKRLKENRNIYVVSGHAKGHIVLYEIKGLLVDRLGYKEVMKDVRDELLGNISFKHCKTIDDIHKTTVLQVKFVGDFRRDLQVISCDLNGIVYLTGFEEGLFSFNARKECLMKKRLNSVYSLAPLVNVSLRADSTQEFLRVIH